jgi:thioesterase domain-containing protein/acyl carrier protein
VVPSTPTPPSATELSAFLKRSLPDYMVPSAFVALESLPISPNGKVDRKALPPPGASQLSLDTPIVPPRDALELRLVRIWEELLGVQPVGVRSNFFELGGHSLLAVRLMASIRESTGKSLPMAALFQGGTVEHLAALLRQERVPWTPLVPFGGGGDGLPFFCVHPVGGNVLCYEELARQLGSRRPFYGLQARGLEGDAPPLESIEEMAALYLEAVRSVQPRGPYLLGGWSMGGLVAFEMARQLERQGEHVALLALIDASARVADLVPPGGLEPARVTALFARAAADSFGRELRLTDEQLARMTPDEVLGHLLEQAREHGVVLPEAGLAQLRALREVFERNLRACARYVPQPYSGPLTLLRASEPPVTTPEERTRGWGPLATRGLVLHELPGTHNTVLRAPHVNALAARLEPLLDQASSTPLPGMKVSS